MLNMEQVYFDFKIVELADGSQLIDENVRTSIDGLTPEMQMEYMEVYNALAVMERMKRKIKRETEQQRKNSRNPLYRLAYLFGIL